VRENQRKIDILAFHREISLAVIELGLICAFLNISLIQHTQNLIFHFPSEGKRYSVWGFPYRFCISGYNFMLYQIGTLEDCTTIDPFPVISSGGVSNLEIAKGQTGVFFRSLCAKWGMIT
jgi:hypothetical protein